MPPDPVVPTQLQIDRHNERVARIGRLKSEAAMLRERIEANAFALEMGLVDGTQFDTARSAIAERIEATKLELVLGGQS